MRVAVVVGRVRSWPELAARGREDGAVAGDLLERLAERRGASLVARGDRHLPAAHDVQHVGEVHVHAEGQRRVAAGEPARGDEHVVHGGDAEAAELLGDRRREVAALLDGGEAVEGKLPSRSWSAARGADLVREGLGERDQARAGAVLAVSSRGI